MNLLEIIPKEVIDTLDKEQMAYAQKQYELLSDDGKCFIAELKRHGFVYWKDGIELIQFRLNMDTEDDMSETSIDVRFYDGCMLVYLVYQIASGEYYIPTEMTDIYHIKVMYDLITGRQLMEVNNE